LENLFEKLFKDLKNEIEFGGGDLENLYFDIVERNRSMVIQKKNMIERIMGEITQLQAFESTLFSALKKYIAKKKNITAEEVRTKKLMELKQAQAEDRLSKALEEEGLGFHDDEEEEEILTKEPVDAKERETYQSGEVSEKKQAETEPAGEIRKAKRKSSSSSDSETKGTERTRTRSRSTLLKKKKR